MNGSQLINKSQLCSIQSKLAFTEKAMNNNVCVINMMIAEKALNPTKVNYSQSALQKT